MQIITHTMVLVLVSLVCACKPLEAASLPSCEASIAVGVASKNTVSTNAENSIIRTLKPSFFGFNVEWVDFQQDLWDSKALQVKLAVLEWLKPFSGASYRYPGGTGSNHLNWRDTVGAQSTRPVTQRVDWLGPIAPQFGFDEYLSFIESVNGSAWYVLNINGDYKGQRPVNIMSQEAADLVSYAAKRATNGKPAILRWELGNELDRYKWPPSKYSDIASQTVAAIQARHPNAKFVGMLQDWPAQKAFTMSEYNRLVINDLKPTVQEFAHHLYYEEQSWVSVAERLAQVCRSGEDAKAVGLNNATFWITEHARGLPAITTMEEWKRTWPSSSSLESALVVAESYIAATQLPQVQGMHLHSLGTAHGPWPLFNASKNDLHPSAVYWGLRVLRDSLLPNVLASKVQSRNDAKSIGGHDMRAAILTDNEKKNYAVWAVNRSGVASKLSLMIPALSGKSLPTRFSFVSDANKKSNNYAVANIVTPQTKQVTVSFDAVGNAEVELPPYSVSAFSMSLK
ncbi:MAG: hypothetical protein V4545_09015 [Pseudomonadota bacterium]